MCYSNDGVLACGGGLQAEDGPMEPARLQRNVYFLSAGFFGIFIAYNTAQVWNIARCPPVAAADVAVGMRLAD